MIELFTDPLILGLVLLGTILGITVGAVPGLTGTMLIALSLPLTFSMEPVAGLVLLVAMYVGAVSGGLISATLLRMPGTPGRRHDHPGRLPHGHLRTPRSGLGPRGRCLALRRFDFLARSLAIVRANGRLVDQTRSVRAFLPRRPGPRLVGGGRRFHPGPRFARRKPRACSWPCRACTRPPGNSGGLWA